MHGISTINIELTSRCNKKCHMCGRRKLEKQNPEYESTLGDMPMEMVQNIAAQIPAGTVVQLHWNGEPTLYPNIDHVALLLRRKGAYVCMDTNGLLLGERVFEFKDFTSITVSVIENDTMENYIEQITQIEAYLEMKRVYDFKTLLNIRALGKIPISISRLADREGIQIIKRIFHAPEMSRDYQRETVRPEIGVCLDLLHHPAIDRHGNVFPCVRFNPYGINRLGNVNETTLGRMLGGTKRQDLIKAHFAGHRNEIELCKDCDYWGVPRG